MKRALMLFCLATCTPCVARAQEGRVEQVVRDLHPDRAERLLKALAVGGGALYEFREETGRSHDDLKLGIRWVPSAPVRSSSGWSLRGRLRAAIVKNPDFATGMMLRTSYRYGVGLLENVPRTADMKFVYDKLVFVRYRRAGGELRISLDSEEEHGTFNMTVSETVRSKFDAGGSFGLSTRTLSLDVRDEGSEVTVVAVGLPYVVRPILEIESLERGDYLTLKWGLLWESRVQLEATAYGATDDHQGSGKLSLAWGQTGQASLEAHGYTERKGFESQLSLQAEGRGLEVGLLYDERVPNRAYDLTARANQRWHVHVAGSPIVQAGSVQEERSTSIGKRAVQTIGFGILEIELPWLPSWAPGDAPGLAPQTGEATGAAALGRRAVPRVLSPNGLETDQARWGRIRDKYCPHARTVPSQTPPRPDAEPTAPGAGAVQVLGTATR